MTRRAIAGICLAMLGLIIGGDLMVVRPNPYRAPAALALGSGAVAPGGFCGALPR